MKISNLSDLRRIVSDQLENYDMSCYTIPYEELVEEATSSLHDFIQACGFKWGQELPELSDEHFRDLTREFEK
jgi:hypothetical protein